MIYDRGPYINRSIIRESFAPASPAVSQHGGAGTRLMLIVRHTDAARERTFDPRSPIRHLDNVVDGPQKRGWTAVDMQKNWKVNNPSQRDIG